MMSDRVWASSRQEVHDYMGISSISPQGHRSERWAVPPKSASYANNAKSLDETDLRLGLGPPERAKPEASSSLLGAKPFKDLPLHSTENANTKSELSRVPLPESEVPTFTSLDNVTKYGLKRGYGEAGSSDTPHKGIQNHALPQKAWTSRTGLTAQTEAQSSLPGAKPFKDLPSNLTENTNTKSELSRIPLPESEVPVFACPENVTKYGVKRGYGEAGSSDTPHKGILPQKTEVIGWPPIGMIRKNALPSKQGTEEKGQVEGNDVPSSTLYVKVKMDGVQVGRKVDLKAYHSYRALSEALKDMFQLPTTGGSLQSNYFWGGGTENSRKPFQFLTGFNLTYEDKDGDWMLVGDVPWRMFVNTVRRLRIMKEQEGTITEKPNIG